MHQERPEHLDSELDKIIARAEMKLKRCRAEADRELTRKGIATLQRIRTLRSSHAA